MGRMPRDRSRRGIESRGKRHERKIRCVMYMYQLSMSAIIMYCKHIQVKFFETLKKCVQIKPVRQQILWICIKEPIRWEIKTEEQGPCSGRCILWWRYPVMPEAAFSSLLFFSQDRIELLWGWVAKFLVSLRSLCLCVRKNKFQNNNLETFWVGVFVLLFKCYSQ